MLSVFFYATTHLYKRSCPSVRPLVLCYFLNDKKCYFLRSDDKEKQHRPRERPGKLKNTLKNEKYESRYSNDIINNAAMSGDEVRSCVLLTPLFLANLLQSRTSGGGYAGKLVQSDPVVVATSQLRSESEAVLINLCFSRRRFQHSWYLSQVAASLTACSIFRKL